MQNTITNTPQIFVACLLSYNSGKICGEWIEVQEDPALIWEEISELLEKTGGEEWQVLDTEYVPDFLGQDIDALAEYRQRLEEAARLDIPEEVYAALVDDCGEIINPDFVTIYGAAEDARGAALAFCEALGGREELAQVIDLTGYVDWERLGRDLLYDMQISGGHLVQVGE